MRTVQTEKRVKHIKKTDHETTRHILWVDKGEVIIKTDFEFLS